MKIGIIGLGYVGLPLAVEFGKVFNTIGFDINQKRIQDLKQGLDSTLEYSESLLKDSSKLVFTSEENDISDCNIYIVTVPTPIDENNKPDLTFLKKATLSIGQYLSKEDIVIYESTVYPGATEEVCVPLLEKASNLKFNKDFYCGYSPERVNPGDKEHKITMIMKIVSGSTPEIANKIDDLYKSIIKAGTIKVSSLKIAEAAKVIENTQRDLNIALINEFSIIFNKLGINTNEVIEAASTKWNFQPYKPGIVGGHCIGVDPYYLTYKSSELGYKPEVILAGRHLNDSMGFYIAEQVNDLMESKGIKTKDARILIMGFAFKENCPDHRNTRVIDIYNRLVSYECNVDIYDPWVDKVEVNKDYGVNVLNDLPDSQYDSIVIAVSHNEFRDMGINKYHKITKENHVIFDVKSVLDKKYSDARL
tara:strand:+ start:472 stop:1731 length:1260 start_codon:yes stop_codon:yes gene_type:complete